ncbi:MAG: hypothetical protein P4L53_14145 [Candidatus Obscuribacterales bacterium]|nr:hypothetical protein [Candidatus Obscuribacterales bacterium]
MPKTKVSQPDITMTPLVVHTPKEQKKRTVRSVEEYVFYAKNGKPINAPLRPTLDKI